MADKHPYSPGPGGIVAAINQLRKSFPKTVDSDTLRKLSIAPKNESYIINILRFLGAIDTDGNRTETAAAAFTKSDQEFNQAFEKMVRTAYSDLFELHKEAAWDLSAEKLMSYFRATDQTSELVGRLQATTFQVLATFAGHGELPSTSTKTAAKATKVPRPTKQKLGGVPKRETQHNSEDEKKTSFGLTVRIEVNLPAGGDQETYDKIFRSIRENLLPNV